MLQIVALAEVILCWIVWSFAFMKPRKEAAGQKEVMRAPVSRWGIGLVMLSFALVWMYVRPRGFEKSRAPLIASMILAPPSVALGWAAAHQLGKYWRYQAALSEDHELVRTGPYRLVRHPIYASMLGMYLSTALAWTWWPLALAGLIAFIAGTEIRVRAEDRLLAERFGESFITYRSRVSAYVPFIR